MTGWLAASDALRETDAERETRTDAERAARLAAIRTAAVQSPLLGIVRDLEPETADPSRPGPKIVRRNNGLRSRETAVLFEALRENGLEDEAEDLVAVAEFFRVVRALRGGTA